MWQASPTVAIVFPGELGSTVGRLLAQRGMAVLTTAEGRSERTRQRAEAAGLRLVPTLRALAAQADIVLALVSPGGALATAQSFVAACDTERRPRIYVDVNSIAPATACAVETVVHAAGLDFVDGAVHGLASRLPEHGTLYLSGPAAHGVAELLGQAFRVRVLPGAAGRASAFKMLISGMAKGVPMLFTELAQAAHRAGLLEELLICYRDAYPGIMALVERMLPTYPRHAARRVEEAQAVEETLAGLGVRPSVARGAREVAEELADAHLDANQSLSIQELIQTLDANHEAMRA